MQLTGPIGRAFWLAFFVAFTQANAQPAKGEKYVFCAYNLKNWLSMDRFDNGITIPAVSKPDEEKERVVGILKDIRPDVLGVCEIGSNEDVADLQKRLKAVGVHLPHVERAHGADPTRTLAILSRFPIIARNSQANLNYKIGEQTLPFQRGILDATIEFHAQLQVKFIGVHLKSMRDVPEADESLMRRNEAQLLRTHIDDVILRNPQARVLCYGDFNEHRNEPAISAIIGSRMSDGFMTDLLLRDQNGQVWTHFWDAADSYSRLDYAFCSRALRPYIDLRSCRIHHERNFDKASDHRPIVIIIKDRL